MIKSKEHSNPNLTNPLANISASWKKCLIIICFLLTFLGGLTAAYSGAIIGHILFNKAQEISIFSVINIAIWAIALFLIKSRGLGKNLIDLAQIFNVTLLLPTFLIALIAFSPEDNQGLNIALGSQFTILGLIGAIAALFDLAISLVLAKLLFIPNYPQLITITAIFGASIGALFGVGEESGYMGYIIAAIVGIFDIIVGIDIGYQATENNPKYQLILWLTLTLTGVNEQQLPIHSILDNSTENIEQIQLSQELRNISQQLDLLSKTNQSAIVDETNPTIHILKELLTKAIERNSNLIQFQQGELNMNQGKGNVNISGTQGNISGIVAAGENQTLTGVAIGNIRGDITNTINQIPESSNPDEPDIKSILQQLQKAIETEQNLDDDDKHQALEQVKTLAKAAQNPQETKMQKLAKGAKNTLNGIISNLPTATKLVEESNKLLPIILKIFGL